MEEDRYLEIPPFKWIDASEVVPSGVWPVVAVFSSKVMKGKVPDVQCFWIKAFYLDGKWYDTYHKEEIQNVLYWMEIKIPEELED